MKKFTLALVAVAVLGISSCKKEEAAAPSSAKSKSIADNKEANGWD